MNLKAICHLTSALQDCQTSANFTGQKLLVIFHRNFVASYVQYPIG